MNAFVVSGLVKRRAELWWTLRREARLHRGYCPN
jgi:hypothetical protein